MKFYNIMPFRPSDVKRMAAEYKRYREATGMKILLCSMTLNPEGDDPYLKPKSFIRAFGELKEELKDSDIELGILLQSFLGHGWTSASPSVHLFQPTINHTGTTKGRMCPLDEKFLQYCDFAVKGLAALKPVTFLLDDDTRLLDNDKLECFCPLHRAKFSKQYTQEELIELVTHAKKDDPIMIEFEKVRRDSLEAFCARIRKAIDSVDPAIPCGISGPGREHLMFERMALAAAGPNTEPFIRVGNAFYGRGCALNYPQNVYKTALMKKACGSVKFILDESDTYPHHRYSQTCAGLHTHLTNAILSGLKGSKTWIENYVNFADGHENVRYEKQMKEYLPFYDELTRAVEGIRWKGVSVPLVNLEKEFTPLEYPDYFTTPEWFCSVLGELGISFSFREPADPDAECFMLGADMVKHFTDAELDQIVKKNLILDAVSAQMLIDRGYGEYLGVTLGTVPHFSFEREVGSTLRMRHLITPRTRLLIPAEGAENVTELVKPAFAGAAEVKYIAPGMTRFRNENGKLVFVWSEPISANYYTLDPARKLWLEKVCDQTADIPVKCPEDQDIMFRCGELPGGGLLAALINLSYDAMKEIPLICKKTPAAVKVLAADGEWKDAAVRTENGVIYIQEALLPNLPIVFKLV